VGLGHKGFLSPKEKGRIVGVYIGRSVLQEVCPGSHPGALPEGWASQPTSSKIALSFLLLPMLIWLLRSKKVTV